MGAFTGCNILGNAAECSRQSRVNQSEINHKQNNPPKNKVEKREGNN